MCPSGRGHETEQRALVCNHPQDAMPILRTQPEAEGQVSGVGEHLCRLALSRTVWGLRMSCSDTCVVMDYDGYNTFSTEATRRARKLHRCCECGEPIAVGESHNYAAGKYDGYFWSER